MSTGGSPKSSNGDSAGDSVQQIKIKTVVLSLLESCQADEQDVRQAAAQSLAVVGRQHPLLVLQEWHLEYGRARQAVQAATPTGGHRKSVAVLPAAVPRTAHLTAALQPVIAVMMKHNSLDPGDVRHRAVLGQIMAVVVEEMLARSASEEENECQSILVVLAGTYMDKVMDVLLVHFQPNSTGTPMNPSVGQALAALADHHPHQIVPFLKALLSTAAHLMKSTKPGDVRIRSQFCRCICNFCEAIQDYVSNIEAMPDSSVTLGHYNNEGDAIYEVLYSAWLPAAREAKLRMAVLEAMAAITPFLSRETVLEKGAAILSSLVALCRKLAGQGAVSLEVTLCVTQLLDTLASINASSLDTILDSVVAAMFHQICVPPDYSKPNLVKAYHEAMRSFDILMKFYPEKMTAGLLQKFESGGDEKSKAGALTVIKHLLNLPTKTLGYRLEEIVKSLHNNLGEPNIHVRRIMAQIVIVLGNHGSITGETGLDFVEFIVKLCSDRSSAEPVWLEGANVLQLLAAMPAITEVLWPQLLEYLLQPEFTAAVGAVARALVSVAQRRAAENSLSVAFQNLQYCSGPAILFARLLVLASAPQEDGRGVHILKFLHIFAPSIHPALGNLWNKRFPLLLHYLEQQESVEISQWHNWLLDLLSDSLLEVGEDAWSTKLSSSLVNQLSMYEADSLEKAFNLRAIGQASALLPSGDQLILDHLSAIYLAAVAANSPGLETAAAAAFGTVAAKHLGLVMSKLEAIFKAHAHKKKSSTMFFGLLRDRSGEEQQVRSLAVVLKCIGEAAAQATPADLATAAESMSRNFLAPCLFSCRDSERLREAVLTAVSQLAQSLKRRIRREEQQQPAEDSFVMSQHDELLHSSIAILQDNTIPLRSKQLALTTITQLIQLPPNIGQLTRCSLLKAAFNTIFGSFLAADAFKVENYAAVNELELQLTSMVDSLNILIRELLHQDMEQSTVDEIFTMLETWLRLDQPLSRELSVSVLQEALKVYVKHVRLGVGAPTNFTPGPYMIGAMVPRCHDPSLSVRKTALSCLQIMLRVLGIYEGLAPETVENSIQQLNSMSARCNNPEISGKLQRTVVSEALVSVLNERVQHQHLLTLMDSLADGLLDSQITGVAGCIALLKGLAVTRGSEVYQNIPGLVSKLHFKMSMMAVDETSDLMGDVAEVAFQLSVHNTRGVVTSLLHLELPIDEAGRLIWSSLAGDLKLATTVLDILLDAISQNQVKQNVNGSLSANAVVVSACAAMSSMFQTHKLEVICRQEFGRIFVSLVVLASCFLNAKLERFKKADAGQSVPVVPYTVAIEALKHLFSAINCVVVSNSIASQTLDISENGLRKMLHKIVRTTSIHAPHLLQPLVSAIIPTSTGSCPDCARMASVCCLVAVSVEKAGGDQLLLSSVISSLLRCLADPVPLTRQMAVEGLSGLVHCSPLEIETLAEGVIGAYIQGIEDEKCSAVSLAALQGFSSVVPVLPASRINASIDLISLKVRPYLEMSGADHRAAAINLYCSLAKFAEGKQRTVYLDHCQSILGPVLLHSTSPHQETSKACLSILAAIGNAAGAGQLAAELATFDINKGLESLVDKLLSCDCLELTELLPPLVGHCLGYFRSQNPMLRRNAIILLSRVLVPPPRPADNQKTTPPMVQPTEADQQQHQDGELITGVIGGVLDLLKDPDHEVRRTAALYIGGLAVLHS